MQHNKYGNLIEKEYERHMTNNSCSCSTCSCKISDKPNFEEIAKEVVENNKELLHKLAESEKKELKGGTKFDSGKPDLSLLPYEALEEISKVLMYGSKKYGINNWKNSLEYRRLIAASLRHIHQFNNKIDKDPETDLSHLAHACCSLMFIIYFQKKNITENDDR